MVKPDPAGELPKEKPTIFCSECGHSMTPCYGFHERKQKMVLKRWWCRNVVCNRDEPPIGREKGLQPINKQ